MWRMCAGCIVAVATGLLSALVASAQPATKTPRIGWLGHGTVQSGAANPGVGDFQDGLRDFGYVDGRNVAVLFRTAGEDAERLSDLAADLVRQKVDVIVTSGESAAFAAKGATSSIPIVVMEFGLDPVKSGLVGSLGRPEANVTGLTTISDELWPKRLGLLREISPGISRVAVIWNPANTGSASCIDEIKAAAPAVGVKLHALEATNAAALQRALAGLAGEQADALAVCGDGVTLAHAKTIASSARKRGIATIAPLREYVAAGGPISYGTNLAAHRRRAAYYVDKILKGAKAGSLPVERPALFELVVNETTAKALGVTLPAALALQVDDVVP